MRRRIFIGMTGVVAAWPLAGLAQPAGKTHRLAILAQSPPVDSVTGKRQRIWLALFEELQRLGFVEQQNLAVDWRVSTGSDRQVAALAREIVAMKPDVIFTPDQRMAGVLKATTAIPIVAILSDPVGFGFAASLARPGGSVTGFSIDVGPEIGAKRLGWLKEAVPAVSRLAWLTPRRHWESRFREQLARASNALGIVMFGAIVEPPGDEADYRRAFAAMARERADSVSVSPALENLVNRRLIADLAAELRLPAICAYRENVEAGALMAYAVDLAHMFRGAAVYIDRILKGAHPGTLPIQQPSKFELAVNLRTAKALGLALSESVLTRADEIIE